LIFDWRFAIDANLFNQNQKQKFKTPLLRRQLVALDKVTAGGCGEYIKPMREGEITWLQ
jgi:hypothetical protein